MKKFLVAIAVLLGVIALTMSLPQSLAYSKFLASPRSVVLIVPASTPKKFLAQLTSQPSVTAKATQVRVSAYPTISLADAHQSGPPLLAVVDQPDIKAEDQKMADGVFRLLPQNCLGGLRNFYVRYDGTLASRGFASEDSIILDGTLPMDQKRSVLIHELGHFFDLGPCTAGNPASGLSAFKDGNRPFYNNDPSVSFYSISWIDSTVRRSDSKSTDFVTGYAGWKDSYEDAAETFDYFITQHADFVLRAQTNPVLAQKLHWMQAHVPTANLTVATSDFHAGNGMPWDATKLPYTWVGVGGQVVAQR